VNKPQWNPAISGGESTDDKVSLPSKAVEIICYTIPIMWRWFRWVLGEFFFKTEGADWPFTGNIPRSVTKFLSCQTVSVKDSYLFFRRENGWTLPVHPGKINGWNLEIPPQRKRRDIDPNHQFLHPWKLTCPLKNDGRKTILLLKWSLFRLDIRSFSGVGVGSVHVPGPRKSSTILKQGSSFWKMINPY